LDRLGDNRAEEAARMYPKFPEFGIRRNLWAQKRYKTIRREGENGHVVQVRFASRYGRVAGGCVWRFAAAAAPPPVSILDFFQYPRSISMHSVPILDFVQSAAPNEGPFPLKPAISLEKSNLARLVEGGCLVSLDHFQYTPHAAGAPFKQTRAIPAGCIDDANNSLRKNAQRSAESGKASFSGRPKPPKSCKDMIY